MERPRPGLTRGEAVPPSASPDLPGSEPKSSLWACTSYSSGAAISPRWSPKTVVLGSSLPEQQPQPAPGRAMWANSSSQKRLLACRSTPRVAVGAVPLITPATTSTQKVMGPGPALVTPCFSWEKRPDSKAEPQDERQRVRDRGFCPHPWPPPPISKPRTLT